MDVLAHLSQAWQTLHELLWNASHAPLLDTATRFLPFVLLFELPVQLAVMLGAVRWYLNTKALSRTTPPPFHPPVTCIITCYSEGEDVKKTIRSLTEQLYPGHIEMLAIVDGAHQNRATAEALRASASYVAARPMRKLVARAESAARRSGVQSQPGSRVGHGRYRARAGWGYLIR